MIRLLIIFALTLFLNTFISAQNVRKYKEHEIINTGKGVKIEIIECRGEGEDEECEVIYYTDKGLQENRQWEKISKIQELEQLAANEKKESQPIVDSLTNSGKEQIINTGLLNDSTPVIATVAKDIPVKNIEDDAGVKLAVITNNAVEKEGLTKVHPVHVYSLDQCFTLAREKNINLKRAQNNINAHVIDRNAARSNLLPSLSYNAGHYFSFGKNIDPVTNTFINENFNGGFSALSLQQLLFSGFTKLNTIKQSVYLVEAAEYAKKRAELELLTNVTLSYARLLLNKEMLLFQRNDILATAKHLEAINEKIKVGRLSKYESYAFDSRFNTEQANLVSLQNDSSAASEDLKHLLNISYKDKIDIAPVNTEMLSAIYDARISTTDFVDTILQHHPAIKQAQMEEHGAQAGLKIAKGYLYPAFSIGGNLVTNYNVDHINGSGQKTPLRRQLNDNIGKNINISLHIPIFSQMENSNRIKKEKINLTNAQLNRQEAESSIITNTVRLINDFNASRLKYMATLSAAEQSNLSYSMYEEKYKIGQISSLELLAARDMVNAANSKYIQAKLELFFRYQILLVLKSNN